MIKPFNKEYWKGRVDLEDGVKGLRWHQLIQEFPNADESFIEKSVVFLGFSSDEGVRRNKGRVGAANAPQVIREMLSGIPKMDSNVSALYDYGDIEVTNNELETGRTEQIYVVEEILGKNTYPLVLGGGHEVAFGNFIALNSLYKNIGVINIDAHFDFRKPHPHTTSGTGFYEMAKWSEENDQEFNYLALGIQKVGNTEALFDRVSAHNGQYILADDIHAKDIEWEKTLDKFIQSVDVLYFTLDMDVFDAAYAPGVSAITTNGLTPYQVKTIIRKVFKSNKVKLMDVAELNPNYDVDNRTAKLAAHMISEMVHHL
ncbi:formimidoylglutamase [Flavobacteriaceae bacterium Ap0902]|nr:formimidoylglutamase [Flavobacteriaceae bacterium Ap0902]